MIGRDNVQDEVDRTESYRYQARTFYVTQYGGSINIEPW